MDFSTEKTSVDIVDTLVDFIGNFEGCANCKKDGLIYAYLCPAGYPTQGYGLLVKDLNVPPITKEEAKNRFKKVLPTYISHAIRLSPNIATDPKRLLAITSFIFNLGPTAYAGSTLRKKVNAQDWTGAAQQIVRWNKGGGRVLKGLTTRRLAEANLLIQDT